MESALDMVSALDMENSREADSSSLSVDKKAKLLARNTSIDSTFWCNGQ